MNDVLREDIAKIVAGIDIEFLRDKTVLITGGTGLIGSILVRSLLYANHIENMNIRIILLTRNKGNVFNMFGDDGNILCVEGSLEDISEFPECNIDYVVHLASPTKSKYFITKPVETLDSIIIGTRNILDLVRLHPVKKFLYVSSMEMYGVLDSISVKESDLGYINNLEVRSSYSQGKRTAELYSYSYCKEYGIPISIARVAMCFGAGVSRSENRVYKSFMDTALSGNDVVVRSSGQTVLNFVYTVDAIRAILLLLKHGVNGEAYNVVSDFEHFTIMRMAEYIAEKCKVSVQRKIDPIGGYAPDNHMVLDNTKLKNLGWTPEYNVCQAIDRTMEYIKNA